MSDVGPTLETDLACLRCGYNLRGLTTAGACPECGLQIERTLHGRYLCYSTPEFIRSLSLGIGLLMIAMHMLLPNGLVMFVLYIAAPSDSVTPLGRFAYVLTYVIAISLTAVFYVIGSWLLLEPDPQCAAVERRISARRIGRFMTALLALTWLGAAVLLALDYGDARPLKGAGDAALVLAPAVVLPLQCGAGAVHLCVLASRAHDRPQRLAVTTVSLFAAAILAGTLLMCVDLHAAPLAGLLAALAGCGLLAFGVALLGDLESTLKLLRVRSLERREE